jgi:hypothetical protein
MYKQFEAGAYQINSPDSLILLKEMGKPLLSAHFS